MANETLELSEHELYFLPPGTPAIAAATRVEVEVDGELRVFLARWESPRQGLEESGRSRLYLFCREVGKEIGIFCFTVYNHSKNFEGLSCARKQEFLERMLLDEKYTFKRYWRAPDSSFGAAFYTDGRAKVFWLNEKSEELEFRWSNASENDLRQWSQTRFLDFCKQLYEKDDSPLRYILRWVNLTSQQKDKIAFGCVNYDWDTMRHTLILAQTMIIFTAGRFPYYRNRDEICLWRFDSPWPEGWEWGQPWSESLRWSNRISEAIYKIIKPAFWPEDTICHHSWRRRNLDTYWLCEVECAPPSAHEALEAQLELREFLRPHLPAAEIEALMLP